MHNLPLQQKVAWQVSRWLSIVLNPSTMAVLGLFLLIEDWWRYVPLLLLFPIAFYLFYTRLVLRQRYDNDVTQRQRILPLLVNLACVGLSIYLLRAAIFTPAQQWLTVVGCLNLLSMVITLRFRISLHMVAVGGLLGFFLYPPMFVSLVVGKFGFPFLIALIPLTSLVYWARWHQRAHTHAQLLSGLLLGLVIGHIFLLLLFMLFPALFL